MIELAPLPAAVLDASLRGALLLLAVLAATPAMRRASASARHLVWLGALAALLVLPLARGVVPEWRILPAPARAPAAAPVASAATSDDGAPVSTPAPGSAAATVAPPSAGVPFDLPRVALLVWGTGAGLLLLRLGWGLARVRRIERRATELTDEGWIRLADTLSRRLGVGRIVRLLREPGARVPMTWGVLRPVVLLPPGAEGWDEERRGVVLAHELAHVRRLDALTQWVAHLALALHWFNPLVWIAVRRLRQEREQACDDAVLEIGTAPTAYAGHLLTLVRSVGEAPAPAAALAMARRSQFEGRLLAILDAAAPRSRVGRATALAATGVAFAVLLPLAALRPAEAAPSATHAAAATAEVADAGAEAAAERRWESTVVVEEVRDGLPRVVNLRAREVFSRTALSAPQRIGRGGELYLEERAGGVVRLLRARPGKAGAPDFTYTVDGVPRPFDAAARRWMETTIAELVSS